MGWLSTENIVAVLTAVLGIVASFAVVWYERRVPHRRRIGYRVQMDTPIGSDNRGGQSQVDTRLGLFNDLPDMSDGTLVLLRIENDGAEGITDTDYTSNGLTVVFTERTVRGVAVTQSDAEHLMDHFAPPGAMRHSGSMIHLPRVPLNRGQHYKLLVLLTGGRVGLGVRVTGGIRDGKVEPNRSTTVDDTPPLFSGPARWITILLTLCVTALAVIVVRRDVPPPIGCATGKLTIIGSTAFAPVVREIAEKYESECPETRITVSPRGSNEGIQELAEAATETADGPPAVISVYDGSKPAGYPQMMGERIGISAFALVVNDSVSTVDLTVDQIRMIYRGDILNWSQVGGPDLPVLLVSRDANSGTRDLFRRRILDGLGEPALTSLDCEHRNSPQDRVVRCELDSTERVLRTVAKLPGAIGYSELQAAVAAGGLHALRINGQTPSIEAIGDDSYPFTEIEYAYTYGQPPTGSLTASFLNYLTRGGGQDVMKAHGHLPCYSPEGFRRCQQ
ncbi:MULTISPECIES: PstS family phosphate ABC transporter substrate-binding protein [Protofrankia]|uniref:Putative phosphate binding ABC transporter n=1 Tax=Candidatus Protofrankia datiscae TaxID=2716812 RepID=F8B6A0_9ACTN|nr:MULTISPECIES: substrate-binding domain-containing protein [Protofrankia]AEH08070.1 putative phosphate binding ABC transporter [Candidatus Protofrankia datiscae]